MKDVILQLDSVSKSFDGKQILNHLDLEIGRNEFITLLGPSGCGKSTTLRIIGGFYLRERRSPDFLRINGM